jgi:hypothetical protein
MHTFAKMAAFAFASLLPGAIGLGIFYAGTFAIDAAGVSGEPATALEFGCFLIGAGVAWMIGVALFLAVARRFPPKRWRGS